ncbi:polysaccharide deacetylase family protein [Kribbella sp. NPDC056951]|uniref:polysaccharide deacetylase family protein n=1 Tax=Kribbella sp. NPDC056951 TaxID=3345978 RepID=UPI0036382998
MTGARGIALLLVAALVMAGCGEQESSTGVVPLSTTPTASLPPSTATPSTPQPSSPIPSTPQVSTPTPVGTPNGRPGASHNSNLMPIVDHGPRDQKLVALTFDADLTAAMRKRLLSGKVTSYYNATLIKELRTLQVPATMFLTGMWMEEYPEVARELAADPLFELGTHTYDHRAFTKHCYTLGSVPRSDMLADVQKAVKQLDKLDPHATRWFRFPGGCYDGTALHELAPAGVTAVGLDVPGADGFAKSPKPIVKQVLSHVQNGSIVVLHMHGGDNAPYTDEAITPIVKELRARGFQLVTVTQLMNGNR